jgi:hypothetical protein
VRRYQYQLKLKKVGAGAVGEIADIARLPIDISYTKYHASLEALGEENLRRRIPISRQQFPK